MYNNFRYINPEQFNSILFFNLFILCFGFSFILLLLTTIIIKSRPDLEKQSIYECGFNSFKNSKQKVNANYYIVSLLFLIIDLELLFLLPFIFHKSELPLYSWYIFFFFLFFLTFGLFVEWYRGALNLN